LNTTDVGLNRLNWTADLQRGSRLVIPYFQFPSDLGLRRATAIQGTAVGRSSRGADADAAFAQAAASTQLDRSRCASKILGNFAGEVKDRQDP
jgi:hypothetical protein